MRIKSAKNIHVADGGRGLRKVERISVTLFMLTSIAQYVDVFERICLISEYSLVNKQRDCTSFSTRQHKIVKVFVVFRQII